MKVLPISAYDMILGLDWMQQHSPMQVHWQQKWMVIPYQQSEVTLYGMIPELPEGALLHVCSAAVDSEQEEILPEIQQMIAKYHALFEIPKDLPPARSCEHSIPLVKGASPFSIRPYRFAPHLKDEIEKQVSELLAIGMIQKSSSPFSSSILLVRKKDNTRRFCVDYRQLNAITIKGKYHIPIIDEFLDA